MDNLFELIATGILGIGVCYMHTYLTDYESIKRYKELRKKELCEKEKE